MKRLLTFAVVCVMAGQAVADLNVRMASGDHQFNGGGFLGGVFEATTQTGGSENWSDYGYGIGVTFETFCVEDVTMSIPNTYIATVDDQIYFGADAGNEYLTTTTKNVYAYYLDGTLGTAFAGTYSDNQIIDAVQAIIWDQQGVSHGGSYNATLYGSIVGSYGSGHAAADSVKVMNLWDSAGSAYDPLYDSQSQLIMIPVPGAALLGVIGLAGVAWLRRRSL